MNVDGHKKGERRKDRWTMEKAIWLWEKWLYRWRLLENNDGEISCADPLCKKYKLFNKYIHTTHALFPKGLLHVRYSSETPTFYKNNRMKVFNGDKI
jgi:hypothetical protein